MSAVLNARSGPTPGPAAQAIATTLQVATPTVDVAAIVTPIANMAKKKKTNKGWTYATTARRGNKTVRVCYDQFNKQINCPKSTGKISKGGLIGIIVAVVVVVIVLLVLLVLLYLGRRRANKARAVGGGTPDAEKTNMHSSDVNNVLAVNYDTSSPGTNYQPPHDSYQPPPQSYTPTGHSYQPDPHVEYNQAGTFDAPAQGAVLQR